MANHISSSAVATSGGHSVTIDDVTSSVPLLPNTQLSEALDIFRANSRTMSDFFTALEERFKAHQSLIGTSQAILNAHIIFLQKEETELLRVHQEQSQMQKKLQSSDDDVKAKLDRAKAFKYACVALYVILTVIGIAVAVAVATAHRNMAMVAAAPYLFGELRKLMDSQLEKPVSALEKERKISKAMIGAGKFTIKDLSAIHELVRDGTEYMLGMVDDDEVAVREKLAEVKERFLILQNRAKHCSLDVSEVKKAALDIILGNMDSGK